MPGPTLSIGELAQQSGCKVPTIRYYEEIGLLSPPLRTEGGHRVYDSEAARQLFFIHRSRELGFSLKAIRSLLALSASTDAPCTDVDAIAGQHLNDILGKISALSSMRDALSDLIEQCRKTTIIECRVIDALQPVDRP